MIDWKELFEGRNVFHCENEDVVNELLKIAHNLGYKWGNGRSYLDFNSWNLYKESSCYKIKTGHYGTVNYYRGENNIIDVNELLYGRKPFKLNRK